MKILKTIPEDIMVLEFLRAEISSPRFGQRYRGWLVRHSGTSAVELKSLSIEIRKELLRSVRPGLFRTLPTDIVWHEIILDGADWDNVMYINEEVWNNFSGGARLVQRGAEKLGQPGHEKLTQRVSEITRQAREGQALPKIILVTNPDLTRLVLLEGHARATAYVASNIYREQGITALLGISEQIHRWAWW